MSDAVLTVNAGSSSIKFALFEAGRAAPGVLARGAIDGIGTAPRFAAHDSHGGVLEERDLGDAAQDHEALLGALLRFAETHLGGDRLIAVGHRVVHGGPDYGDPVLVSAETLSALEALTPLAPLHQPHNLSPIRAIARARPDLPQVACFDTAFHRTMPAVARRIALPREYEAAGVRRYGFHGLSYEYIARRLRALDPALAAGRVIVAHLGNGASLCAMRDGRSVDTTMGFSALDGLVMGTRPGSIDPGVLLYLMQQRGMDAQALEDLLYHHAGLLGVSGIGSDMRALLESDEAAAREAVALFVFRLAREAGALASSLGGLDGFVFTAGIGEHAAPIRAAACERLAWLGLVLDPAANARAEAVISAPTSAVVVRVIPTDEEGTIARHVMDVIGW